MSSKVQQGRTRPTGEYRIAADGLYQVPSDPKQNDIRLTTFTAEIITDITVEGNSEPNRLFTIRAKIDNDTVEFELDATQFERMDWVLERLGPRARMTPRHLIREIVKDAIQSVSTHIQREHVFRGIGWTSITSKDVYVHGGGFIRAR